MVCTVRKQTGSDKLYLSAKTVTLYKSTAQTYVPYACTVGLIAFAY